MNLGIRKIISFYKRGAKDTRGTFKLINLKQTDAMAYKNNNNRTENTTTKQHEPHQELWQTQVLWNGKQILLHMWHPSC